jgi:transcriptional regulator with XRE-family HTH domain
MRGFSPAALNAARVDAKLSRPELARRAGVGHATVYQWEKGHTSPQVNLLARVVAVLGKKMTDVIDIPVDERFPGDWRVLAGLLQPSLGRLAHVSTSTIAQIERGQTELSDAVAIRLADALGISVAVYRESFERVRHRPPNVAP